MAVLGSDKVRLLYSEGFALHIALYAVVGATTGDTVDLAGDFAVVKQAVIQGATVVGQGVVSTIAGTVVTLPSGIGGTTPDGLHMLVQGEAGTRFQG